MRKEKFSGAKQNIYKSDSENVMNLFKSAMEDIEKRTAEQFEALLKEDSIDERLEQLDTYIIEQDSQKSSWRPSRDPETDVSAHCAPARSQGLDVLEKILSAVEKQHCSLIDEAKQWEEKVVKSKASVKATADSAEES